MPREDRSDLRAFFEPASIAAVGSLREMYGTAHWLIKNIRDQGYSRPVYAVLPGKLMIKDEQ